MKAAKSMTLSGEALEKLESMATETGHSVSACADSLITGKPLGSPPRQVSGPQLRPSERNTVMALSSEWKTTEVVTRVAGHSRGVVVRALLSLKRLGLIESDRRLAETIDRIPPADWSAGIKWRLKTPSTPG